MVQIMIPGGPMVTFVSAAQRQFPGWGYVNDTTPTGVAFYYLFCDLYQ